MYRPGGLFRYDGGTTWTACGTPDGKRVNSLAVYNGSLWATGYDEAGIYRYDGRTGTIPVKPEKAGRRTLWPFIAAISL